MSRPFCKLGLSAALITLFAGTSLYAAEQPTADQILKALRPKPLTRSLSGPAPKTLSAEDQRFIDSLRNKPTRSLSPRERDRVAEIAKEKPGIDLEINFDYNSANINAKAQSAVN